MFRYIKREGWGTPTFYDVGDYSHFESFSQAWQTANQAAAHIANVEKENAVTVHFLFNDVSYYIQWRRPSNANSERGQHTREYNTPSLTLVSLENILKEFYIHPRTPEPPNALLSKSALYATNNPTPQVHYYPETYSKTEHLIINIHWRKLADTRDKAMEKAINLSKGLNATINLDMDKEITLTITPESNLQELQREYQKEAPQIRRHRDRER